MKIDSFSKHNLENEYLDHAVFDKLEDISGFYDSLSNNIIGFLDQGTKSLLNLDTFVFMSISGTIDSIKMLLSQGRINDAYALLRKYYDSTIINVYTNLYLNDHFSLDNLIVEQIEDWRSGRQTIPEYRIISNYIYESKQTEYITTLLRQDNRYRRIRERCNDHTHYNFYRNVVFNINQIHNPKRVQALNQFQEDLIAIFIQHLSYLFCLNDHYMMSSDYVDYLDAGMVPVEGSQYWVSPFVQKVFDDYIKKYRPEIASAIKERTAMELQ